MENIEPRQGIYHIRPLDEGHNQSMLAILEASPVVTDRITICFDRRPDIFRLPRCHYDDYFYQGLFRDDKLQGFGMVGYHQALVNGVPEEVYCCRDLYVHPGARGNGFTVRSVEAHFREHRHRSPIGYGLVMAGNSAPLKYLGRRPGDSPFFPLSRILGRMVVKTILLALPVTEDRNFRVRRATLQDVPEIVGLLQQEHRGRLFGQVFTEADFPARLHRKTGLHIHDYFLAFDRNGLCCGVCAAWDTGILKQTRVKEYGAAFLPARAAWTFLSLAFSLPPLPPKGGHFRDAVLTDYAVRDRDPAVMNALLRTIYREYRHQGHHFLTWGSNAGDPLLKAASGFFCQHIVSNIVFFSTDEKRFTETAVKNHLPYIDVAAI